MTSSMQGDQNGGARPIVRISRTGVTLRVAVLLIAAACVCTYLVFHLRKLEEEEEHSPHGDSRYYVSFTGPREQDGTLETFISVRRGYPSWDWRPKYLLACPDSLRWHSYEKNHRPPKGLDSSGYFIVWRLLIEKCWSPEPEERFYW